MWRGIGITPFVSMTREMVEKAGCSKEVKLVYGVNKPEEFIYNDHFEKLESSCKKFEYIKVVAAERIGREEKVLSLTP